MTNLLPRRRKSEPTLLLNADCQPLGLVPISTLPWRKSIQRYWAGELVVMHVYENWIVRSPSVELQVPSVVMLKKYQKPRFGVAFSRENVFVRDNYMCQYCLEVFAFDDLTFDHVIPDSHGGPTNWTNIASACKPCNHGRGCNTKIRPVREPYKPTYWEMADKYKLYPVRALHESWVPYLDWRPELIRVAA